MRHSSIVAEHIGCGQQVARMERTAGSENGEEAALLAYWASSYVFCRLTYQYEATQNAAKPRGLKRIKRDDAQDLDRGELDGLEDGVPRTNMATRAQKYRTQEPDDGL